MTLEPGASLLHYRLHERIGQGGMGEVWRATDTTLDREVAVKVLPESFAGDAERLARFEREAKLLASLSHPNIASIHALHESKGLRFLAMELAPGENLAERIARGAIPMEEALGFALRISEGLEAAHEQGVIHRDLKPANVVVGPGGALKILDFGLAKALEREPASGDPSMMATVTTPATQAGVILGTAAYMSPEQARGRAVDKRSDIWSFGVVLWEMLTGRRPFGGETVSDTLASVLKESPDFTALPKGTPAAVRTLLRRCLEKDPRERLRDIGEARILLTEAIASPGSGVEADSSGAPSRRLGSGAIAAILAAGLVVGAAAAWVLKPSAVTGPEPSYHLSIDLPDDRPLGTRLSRPVALSPDGSTIVYSGRSGDAPHLFARDLTNDDTREIPGSDDGIDPFFSPDGKSLGFINSGTFAMKRIALDGVAPTVFIDSGALVGSIWGTDGYIYYTHFGAGPEESRGAIMRIPAAGGTPEQLTPGNPKGDVLHVWPDLLPGGKTLLYAVVPGMDFTKAGIRALDLGTRKERVLLPSAQLARYVPTGHLVYLQGNTILATRFDPLKVETLGNPTAVLTNVLTNPDSGSAAFAFSRNGTLAYVSGRAGSSLSFVTGSDREGRTRHLIAQGADYLSLAASPVEEKLAVAVQEKPGSYDIWIHDIRRGTFERITSIGHALAPCWTPDGRWIYFASFVGPDKTSIMRVRADGSGDPEQVGGTFPILPRPTSISPDGRWLMFDRVGEGNFDLTLVPLKEKGDPVPFLATPANEGNGQFSPDGRFVAYLSDQVGEPAIFIRPFPGPGQAWRVPSKGVQAFTWARNGSELLYLAGTDVMAVGLGKGPDIRPGTPRKLFSFEGAPMTIGGFGGPDLVVLPDGTIVSIRPAGDTSGPKRIEIVLNWFQELERQVP
ncbi:MAG TPA: protein kinase [Candidatus Saccharimonadales bacterium]|nr:protein kinase [Candidatus Saccharimonadales bacterium]